MVDIKINTSDVKGGFDKACTELEDLLFERVKIAGEHLKAKTVEEAPSDTGGLEVSIFSRASRKKGELKAVVGSNLEYAPYVHQGTGIYAKGGNGRKGYWVFVKGSNGRKGKKSKKSYTLDEAKKIMAILRKKGFEAYYTCGQKPNPFLLRAKEKGLGDIKRLLGVD